MRCRIFPHLVADGPAQMALDGAILEAVSEAPDAAVLRTYAWSPATLSLGYFQPAAPIDGDSRFARVPMVRRTTGGGAIWHDRELTYSLVLPRSHPASARPQALYEAVHGALVAALAAEGIPARRRGPQPAGAVRPFLCFTDRDPDDIVVGSAKVVGSAQRRRPGAVLQHGSLLLGASPVTPELPGIAELAPGVDADAAAWSARLIDRVTAALGLAPEPSPVPGALADAAERLAAEVFRTAAWNRKR
jgi:lipoate-protein ligase A